ncbi:MAG: PKD domain-containing protein, partial [Pseudomonadota bacterium]
MAAVFGMGPGRWLCACFALLFVLGGEAAFAQDERHALWIADSRGLLAVSEGQVLREIPISRGADAAATDASASTVWAYSPGGRLSSYGFDGEQRLAVDLPGLNLTLKPEALLVDGRAGNVWLAIGNRLLRLGLDGSVRDEFSPSLPAFRALALDAARSRLWATDGAALYALDADGSLAFTLELAPLGLLGARDLSWDVARNQLWVLDGTELRRFDENGDAVDVIPVDAGFVHVAADGSGGAWLAAPKRLVHLDATGAEDFSTQPWSGLLEVTADLIAQPRDGSAWIASGKRAINFDLAGEVLQSIDASEVSGVRVFRRLAEMPDAAPPVIAAESPPNGGTLSSSGSSLSYRIDDPIGVDPASIKVVVNGADRSTWASFDDGVLTVTPEGAWPVGTLDVMIEAADVFGNRGSASFYYLVQAETAAYPRASPQSGPAPLTVIFVPETTSGTAIELYQWDFQSDGVIDRSDTIGNNQTWTYNTPGTYEALLRVTDSTDRVVEATVTIEVLNAPPQISASANPSNGPAPLAVSFSATASDHEGVASYEWDFEGDGVYDTSAASSAASHTYETAGTFQPQLRVTDTLGASSVVAVPSIEVRVASPGAPSVTLTPAQSSGNVPLTVSFTASATDPEGLSIDEYAFDFEGDGVYDQIGASSTASHVYPAPGTYYPRVRVQAADGETAEDVAEVQASATFGLSMSTDTIDPGVGESVIVTTNLSGRSEVSLVIENRAGTTIRTLVPWTTREAGRYDDVWDGTGEGGQAVAEGDYYAVLQYRVDGVDYRLDLRNSTGGARSNPPRTSIPASFAPFAGDPLEIDFTLSRAAEVT